LKRLGNRNLLNWIIFSAADWPCSLIGSSVHLVWST
jgi:hypothetical protein